MGMDEVHKMLVNTLLAVAKKEYERERNNKDKANTYRLGLEAKISFLIPDINEELDNKKNSLEKKQTLISLLEQLIDSVEILVADDRFKIDVRDF